MSPFGEETVGLTSGIGIQLLRCHGSARGSEGFQGGSVLHGPLSRRLLHGE